MRIILTKIAAILGALCFPLSFLYRYYVVSYIGYWPLLWDHYDQNGDYLFPGAPYTWYLQGLGMILLFLGAKFYPWDNDQKKGEKTD